MDLEKRQFDKIAIYSGPKTRTIVFAFLWPVLEKYEINTPLRIAAFLAQIIYESGSFRYSKEVGSGAVYEGRLDLGNINKGDGIKFKGRGWIQVTGRSNYTIMAEKFNIDCVNHPEILEETRWASETAGYYWKSHNLNEFADHGDFREITRKINGGYNGLQGRMDIYNQALNVFDIKYQIVKKYFYQFV